MKLNYLMPTKVVMGVDCIKSNADLLAAMGSKALIVTGKHSAKSNGSLDDMTEVLKSNGQTFSVYDKIMSNPTIDCVYDGANFAKQEKIDFIIAIGGGSPMDAAKAINLLTCQDIPREELFLGSYGSEILPMAFVPTTAGTGSEVTQYSILTNDKAETKTSIATPLLFPTVAFLDAKYMMGLSLTTTINTAVDALSHSVEGMLSARASDVSDTLAARSISLLCSCFDALKTGALSLEIREVLLYASMLAGMVIANTGTTVVHAMGYSLTYFRDVDHGRANGLVLPAFLEFVQTKNKPLIDKILATTGFASVTEFGNQITLLLGEREHLSKEEMVLFSGKAVLSKNVHNCSVVVSEPEILTLYQKSFA